jgi:hypothetical protein
MSRAQKSITLVSTEENLKTCLKKKSNRNSLLDHMIKYYASDDIIEFSDYYLKQICDNLGIKLNIIDWNLQKWIENEAYDVYQKTKSPVIERMVRFDWFKYFDNVIVMGEGEPYWRREFEGDYTKKSKWNLLWVEDYFMSSIYAKLTGQTVIGEWYNYTPEVVKSFHKLPLVKKLLDDGISGKVSCWSSRTEIHKDLFPDIEHKIKLVGYEGYVGNPFDRPSFMTAFQEEVIGSTSNTSYKFKVEEIDNLLCE